MGEWEMWIVKLQICCEGAFLGGLCKAFNVSAFGQPVFISSTDKINIVYITLFLVGESEDKKEFVEALKKSGRLVSLECNDDLIFVKFTEDIVTRPLYRYDLIHIKPIEFNADGTEIWTLGGWDRENLIGFINQAEKLYPTKILKLHQRGISSISLLTAHPDLTALQGRAMEVAVQNGYYNSPRNVELKTLSKIMGISYSTFQVHLRKAEKKLLPFYFNHGKNNSY